MAPCRDTRPSWGEEHNCASEHFSLHRLHCEKGGSNSTADKHTWQTAFVKWEQVRLNKPCDNAAQRNAALFFNLFIFLFPFMLLCTYKTMLSCLVIQGEFCRCQACRSHPPFCFLNKCKFQQHSPVWRRQCSIFASCKCWLQTWHWSLFSIQSR